MTASSVFVDSSSRQDLGIADTYQAVDWEVIFLLAGVIPLGIAFEASGTADLIATGIVAGGAVLPPIAMLATFYLGTAIISEMVSNNASVVLMLPIAVEVAEQLGANAFAFVLAVTFAASTPLLSPVGYQTNLGLRPWRVQVHRFRARRRATPAHPYCRHHGRHRILLGAVSRQILDCDGRYGDAQESTPTSVHTPILLYG